MLSPRELIHEVYVGIQPPGATPARRDLLHPVGLGCLGRVPTAPVRVVGAARDQGWSGVPTLGVRPDAKEPPEREVAPAAMGILAEQGWARDTRWMGDHSSGPSWTRAPTVSICHHGNRTHGQSEVGSCMISRMILSIVAVLLLSACQRGLLIWDNAATLSMDVDVPNKALLLTYEFESPVRAVRFAHRPERAGRLGWSVLDSEMNLNEHILARIDSGPFESVTVKASIDEDSTDRGESAVRAIGDAGLVMFNAYLWLDGIRVTDITANITLGQVVVHEGFVSDIGAEKVVLEHAVREPLHVYFGDRTSLAYAGDTMLVASADPENNWLTAIRDNMEPAMQWIDAFFESTSRFRPIVFVFFSEDDELDLGEFSGTATSAREVLLSFKGGSGMWEGDLREDWFGRVVFPSLVNSAQIMWWGLPDTRGAAPRWLFDGISGYLAIAYAHSAGGDSGEQTFLSAMEQVAVECLNVLEEGNFGIALASARAGTTIYDECGVFASWLIDGQPGTVDRAERLRAVLAHMKEMPRNLSVDKLRRAMESQGTSNAWEPLQMLIEGPRGRLWQRRSQLLERSQISP